MLEETTPIHKHIARFIAILSLYSYEMQDKKNLEQIAQTIKKAYLSKDIFDPRAKELEFHSPDEQTLSFLLDLSSSKKDEIEEQIKNNLIEKYSFNKLDRVIQVILKLATLELLYCGDVPAKIIIDEYVSLTKTFYENNEAGFVNKVIDVIARTNRKLEFDA